MLEIHVMHDSGIDGLEEQAIRDALEEFLRIFPEREILFFGDGAWSIGDYSSADWYVKRAQQIYQKSVGHVQLNADYLLDLILREPWQDVPHIDVMLTSHDLTATDDGGRFLNFVFGLTHRAATVQSVYRFRPGAASLSDEDRYLAIKMLIHHELGHIFLMAADPNRSHTEESLGEHCTNPGCVMRQGLSVPEWVQHARESYDMGMVYCPQCLADAAAVWY